MVFPTFAELKRSLYRFVEFEQLSWRTLFRPRQVISILLRHRFIQFLVVGGAGVALNLMITWALTTFVFGLQNYFIGYIIGTAVNLLFNFIIFTLVIFKTSRDHLRRLAVYLVYIISFLVLQALIIRTLTPLLGLQYYLLVIAGVIGFASIINFMVFKLSIFKERA